MRSSLYFCLSFAYSLCAPSLCACASHLIEKALSKSLQSHSLRSSWSPFGLSASAAKLNSFSLGTLLQRGAVLPFYTQAAEAQLIWHPQVETTPESPKLTPQPLTCTGTGMHKSPAGAKAIQAEVPALPEQGECWHRSYTCVGGWCLGLIWPWNFDIIKCRFRHLAFSHEGRPSCIHVPMFILHDINLY